MSKFFLSSILLVALVLSSCELKNAADNEKPVARVYDEYLYPSDLEGQIPSGLDNRDSMRIARRLTEEWIRNRLLLKQAEIHIPGDMQEIERQVEEYRSSLLIFKYKQNLLAQNLDSLIKSQEIEEYYNENASNYILENDIVQVNFVKIKSSAPNINEVRRWCRSDNEDDIASLREYCRENAASYLINDSSWIRFTDLIDSTPLNIDNPSRYLNYNRNIETKDSDFYYFIRIKNRKKEGELKPLSVVKKDIKTVLINKRKLEYLQDLENTVYKEGLSRNQVEIY